MDTSLKRRLAQDEANCDEDRSDVGEPAMKVQRGLADLATVGSLAQDDEDDRCDIAGEVDKALIESDTILATSVEPCDNDHPASVSSPSASQPLVFDILGNELVIKIFSYLPVKDLLRSCCRVCRKWYKLSRAPELWRHVTLDVNKLGLKRGMDYRPTLITDDIFTNLTSLSEGIVNVDLSDCNALSVGEKEQVEACFRCLEQ